MTHYLDEGNVMKIVEKGNIHVSNDTEQPKAIPLFGPDKPANDTQVKVDADAPPKHGKMPEQNPDEAGKFGLGKLDNDLIKILSVRRPHGSDTEERFIKEFLDVIPGMQKDEFGNRYIRIGDAPVMWACHTDTVHSSTGYQSLTTAENFVHLSKKERQGTKGWRGCLGADDGAGIWLCKKMIERKVPGLYVFHRGEEIGGIGSSWISRHNEEFLTDSLMAIALDRKGYDSVITHQGSRCCSDEFALALAKQLGDYSGQRAFAPDPTGLFTDTANYTSDIPECTNLSVGYFRQHGPSEVQNFVFLEHLLERLCEVDVEALPIVRDVNDHSYGYSGYDNICDGGGWSWDERSGSSYRKTDKFESGRRTYSTTVITGGNGDNYNGREYDFGAGDPWDDDPNNPDQYEAARRTPSEHDATVDATFEEVQEKTTTTEEEMDRFRILRLTAQEFPDLIAEIMEDANITMSDMVEFDPWGAASLVAEKTDLSIEDINALIDDELYVHGHERQRQDDT